MKRNRALLFWLAVLFVFGGTMTILYTTGLLSRSREVAVRARADTATDMSPAESGTRTVATTTSVADTFQMRGGTAPDSSQVKSSAKADMGAAAGAVMEDFQMTDQLGRKFHSDELKGQIWIGSVFFSNCPSTCRMQNAEVAKLQHEYADKGVRLVSITCDPERDTVDRLADYARTFNANPDKWHFLTGDYEIAERIGNEFFGITVQRETHSDRLVLVNRGGKVHATYRSMLIDDVMKLRRDLDKLLAAEADGKADIAGTDQDVDGGKPDPTAAEASPANDNGPTREVAVSAPGS